MQVYEAGERCKTKETAHRRPQNQTEASKGYSVEGAGKDGILYYDLWCCVCYLVLVDLLVLFPQHTLGAETYICVVPSAYSRC